MEVSLSHSQTARGEIMKIIGLLFVAFLGLSINAQAGQVVVGHLVKSGNVFELEVSSQGEQVIIYDLAPAGNNCGRMITNGQLEKALGSMVELTGDLIADSGEVDQNGNTHATFVVRSFPDGNRVIVVGAGNL